MNANLTTRYLTMFLVSFTGSSFAEPAQPVAVKTDGMPPQVAAKVKEKAAQGVAPLRRYVDSTRMVNALDFRSLLREVPAERPVLVAQATSRR